RGDLVTGVQTCALPISASVCAASSDSYEASARSGADGGSELQRRPESRIDRPAHQAAGEFCGIGTTDQRGSGRSRKTGRRQGSKIGRAASRERDKNQED